MKRGQVALFVILAIFVIGILSLLIIFQLKDSSNESESEKSINPKTEKEVVSSVETCIYRIGEDALSITGESGSYYQLPKNIDKYGIPYYFYIDSDLSPSLEEIEKQIADYMKDNLFACEFEVNSSDAEIDWKKSESQINILDDKVVFKIKLSVTISTGEKTTEFNNFAIDVPIKVKHVHDTAKEVVKNQLLDTNSYCINCIEEIANKNRVSIQAIDVGNGEIEIEIADFNSVTRHGFYRLIFSSKYEVSTNTNETK